MSQVSVHRRSKLMQEESCRLPVGDWLALGAVKKECKAASHYAESSYLFNKIYF